jgi:hypothetical protein
VALEYPERQAGCDHVRSRFPTESYWIVNLVDQQVEVFTDPTATGYGSRFVYAQLLPDRSVPVVMDGILVGQIAVADILSAEISMSQS